MRNILKASFKDPEDGPMNKPMNSAVTSLLRSALSSAPNGSLKRGAILGPQGSDGPDRINKIRYNENGQVVQMRRAVGTPLEQAEVTYTYTENRQKKHVIDANGNRAEYIYDGLDRLTQWRFPSKTRPSNYNDATPQSALASAGSSSNTDYEQYGYDANGNRTFLRKRDGFIITYQYDALNRNIVKVIPERSGLSPLHTRDVYYSYDLRGLQLGAHFNNVNGLGVTNTYDGFGRMTSARNRHLGGFDKTITYSYDDNSNRTEVRVVGDTFSTFSYEYDGLNRAQKIYNGSGAGDKRYLIQTLTYNNRSQLQKTLERYRTNSNYSYDAVGRLSSINHDLRNSANDLTYGFDYNPASQINSRTISNDAYANTAHYDVQRNYTTNGLNQYTGAGPAAFTYDGNGNLTSDGTVSFQYDVENRLVRAKNNSNGATTANLYYDPLGRLYNSNNHSSAGIVQYLYDGDALIAEYDVSGKRLRTYGHGTGVDDILWSYEWGQPNLARIYHKNHQGSVVAVTSYGGNPIAINGYDAYGIPNETNIGRFQYTGQIWLPEIGMYYYKARIYSPTLGRFLQTDPIGYEDQYNLYAYVGNDPVNLVDPTGLYTCEGNKTECGNVRTFLKNIDTAINNLSKDESNSVEVSQLQNARDFYGEEDDADGPTVTFGRSRGVADYNKKTNTVTFDKGKLNSAARSNANANNITFGRALGIVGAAVAAHEGIHGYNGDGDIRTLYFGERDAYAAQGSVFKGLGTNDASSFPTYTRGVPYRQLRRNQASRALKSCSLGRGSVAASICQNAHN